MTSTAHPDPNSTRAPDRSGGAWRWPTTVGLFGLTAWSAGIGWQAHAVSYPFFRTVPADHFLDYHAQYNAAIPVVVIAPGFAAFLLATVYPWLRPAAVPRSAAVVVSGAGVVALLSTVLFAIPRHNELDRIGQDAQVVGELMQANLVRSVAASVAVLALGWILSRAARRSGTAG